MRNNCASGLKYAQFCLQKFQTLQTVLLLGKTLIKEQVV